MSGLQTAAMDARHALDQMCLDPCSTTRERLAALLELSELVESRICDVTPEAEEEGEVTP